MPQTNATVTSRRCECPTCGEVFSTISNFDRHRVGRHGVDRKCLNPSTVGLSRRDGANGSYWAMPGPEESRWRE